MLGLGFSSLLKSASSTLSALLIVSILFGTGAPLVFAAPADVSLTAINAGIDVFDDFTIAGVINAVVAEKAAYDTAVATAKGIKGSDLTLSEVQAQVDTINPAITAFTLPGQVGATTIVTATTSDPTYGRYGYSIFVPMPSTRSMTAHAFVFSDPVAPASFSIQGSSVSPATTTTHDFSGPIPYDVTSADTLSTRTYYVRAIPLDINALITAIAGQFADGDSRTIYNHTQANYTDASWLVYNNALSAATSTEVSLTATASDVSTAVSALAAADAGLIVAADQANLDTVYAAASPLIQGDYWPTSWAPFAAAMALASGTNATVVAKTLAIDTATSTLVLLDSTPPSAFAVGAVSAVGGTVVPNMLNVSNTSFSVAVPVANDATLVGGTAWAAGTIQLKASLNGGATTTIGTPHIIVPGDVNTTVVLSTTTAALFSAFPSLTTNDVLAFTAVITDQQGNVATGTPSVTTLTASFTIPTLLSVTASSTNASTTLAKVGDTVNMLFTASKSITPVVSIAGHSTTSTNVSGNIWSTSYTLVPGDTTGAVPFSIAYADLAGNAGFTTSTTTDTTAVTFDKTVPTLSLVAASSTNASTTLAKVGDTVSLLFTASEPIQTPVVSIASHSTTTTHISGNIWRTSYTLVPGDATGPVAFSVDYTDLAGNAGFTTSTTTSSSTVTFDKTAPTAFTVGAVTATGGTVVANKWNASNTGLSVTVPIANDSTLLGGTLQILVSRNGAATTTLGTAQTITAADINTATTTAITAATFEALSGFADTDSFAFTARITDAAGNIATGTQSASTVTADQTNPTVTRTGAASIVLHSGDTYTDAGATTADAVLAGAVASIGLFAGGSAIVASSTGTTTILYTATDAAGNIATTSRTIEVYPLSVTQAIMATTTTVDSATPSLVVGSTNTATSTITVPSNVTNAGLDLSALVSGSSATIPGNIVATLSTTLGTVNLAIPAGITITASGTWDGVLALPNVIANSSVTPIAVSGYSASVAAAVEVGAGTTELTFDKAARILLPGMAGKLAGYSRGGSFTQISSVCAGDTQADGDALAAGGACYTTSGSDMVIWTKHFTTFAAYTQTVNPVSPGGNGAPVSGGGGGIVVAVPAFAQKTTATTPTSVTAPSTEPQGQVLGVSSFNFTQDLAVNATGEDVAQLQTMLIAAGYLKGAATGTFGPLTKAAVSKYQKAHKVSQTGTVGPKTRALLNDTLTNPVAAAAASSSVVLTGTVVAAAGASTSAVNPAVPATFTKQLAAGSTGTEVTALQKALIAAGYLKATASGTFGPATRAAVIKYQKAHNLTQTGALGPQTRAALNSGK